MLVDQLGDSDDCIAELIDRDAGENHPGNRYFSAGRRSTDVGSQTTSVLRLKFIPFICEASAPLARRDDAVVV